MYIYGVLKNSNEELTDIHNLFNQIYQDTEKWEPSKHEGNTIYAVVYEKNQAVAAGAIVFQDDDKAQITQVFVQEEKRGQKYGDMALRMLLTHAFQKGINRVNAFPNSKTTGFFVKMGFLKTDNGYAIEEKDFIPPCHRK